MLLGDVVDPLEHVFCWRVGPARPPAVAAEGSIVHSRVNLRISSSRNTRGNPYTLHPYLLYGLYDMPLASGVPSGSSRSCCSVRSAEGRWVLLGSLACLRRPLAVLVFWGERRYSRLRRDVC